ncbi:flagellar basal-body rod protein FlgG [bacterium BMS3Bbin06]|nr:flagellar basal-body rod protein FlgG [bacterium BMS3Abin08]GBE35148.1 flagellar basal-body rod protein FlgG [bacterium BMS3Bbin06]HDO36454.1 flagellar basal-body rod protein FlgG [Nitrospirota bacterium]HDY70041.1 flagellar basal-body rod protein FlgG [Nitrospirota bacterium]
MMRSLFIAATGMEAQKLNIEVISNNLANANTPGFKKSRADFQELMYQEIKTPGAASGDGAQLPSGIQIGLGVKPAAVQKIFEQGDFVQTGNPLDMTIEGGGFFQVVKPDGEIAYTRAGTFKLDSEGRIVTSNGYAVEPEITIPSDTTQITIGDDGRINVLQPGSNTPTEVGQMELAKFANPGGLKPIGKSLFVETASSGAPNTGTPGSDGLGTIQQGFIEMSNVDVVEEMIQLIVSQRAYELSSKTVQAVDEMLQMTNNIKR